MKNIMISIFIIGISLYTAIYMTFVIEVKHKVSYMNTMLSQILYKQYLNIPIRDSTKETSLKYIEESENYSRKRLRKKDAAYYLEIFQVVKDRVNKISTP